MTSRGMRRRRVDLVLMAIGAAVLVTTTLLAKRRVPARAPTESTRAGPNTDERGDRSDHPV
jgi:hypothetical protein